MTGIQTSITLSLEGNIGCGKTTLLRLIGKQFPQITLMNQPLGEWENVAEGKVNLLDLYYKDPKRWGLTFQNYALFTRVRRWKQNQESRSANLKVSERSLEADRYIFAAAMREENFLTQQEHLVYLQYYQGYIKMLDIKPLSGIIYLRCPPETCLQRINKRHREGQDSIPLNYLNILHKKHEQWLANNDQILILDTSLDFEQNQEHQKKILQQIREYMTKFRTTSI